MSYCFLIIATSTAAVTVAAVVCDCYTRAHILDVKYNIYIYIEYYVCVTCQLATHMLPYIYHRCNNMCTCAAFVSSWTLYLIVNSDNPIVNNCNRRTYYNVICRTLK